MLLEGRAGNRHTQQLYIVTAAIYIVLLLEGRAGNRHTQQLYIVTAAIYIQNRKNILKMKKEVRMLLPKKELIQVEDIGKINNYYEDIYIPPYNNTD